MKSDVEDYCKSCIRCIKRKTLPKKAAPLCHLQSDGPLDLVCMDFLSIEPDSRNTENVLVITDHYTRYTQAFPTRDQKASTVAKVLIEMYFVHYGLPKRMHSDQGRDFESRLVHEVLSTLGIEKSRTTPYHPQGDPQPERFNRTLLNMLETLEPSSKRKWSQHIGHLVHAYNCTSNEATGFSPYYLMFGREARLPVDLCFGTSSDDTRQETYLKYVTEMRKELKAAYELAESIAAKQNEGNKRRYDQKIRCSQLLPGDRVLIRNLGLQGKHKLADRWASNPYVVDSQMPDLPVFRLKPEDGNGPIKILHRNHILPLVQNPVPGVRVFRKKRKRLHKLRNCVSERSKVSSETSENKDKEEKTDNCHGKEYTDSEDEGSEICYDLSAQANRTGVEKGMSEPFSLDLDMAWDEVTERQEVTQPEAIQEVTEEIVKDKGGSQPESAEMSRETGTHETGEMREKSPRNEVK